VAFLRLPINYGAANPLSGGDSFGQRFSRPGKNRSVPDGNRIQEIKVALANSAKDASLKNNLED
jgi:hypothetical protein